MATESTKTKTDKTPATDESAPEETAGAKSAAEDEGSAGSLRKGGEKKDRADASEEPADAVGPLDDDAAGDLADDDDLADREAELDAADAEERDSGRGWGAGAAAVVSAGLGLASLTGTSFGEMLRERKQLIGQISSGAQGSGGSATEQVNALYGAPWHAAAVVNGIFAVLAVVVGGILLAMLNGRVGARPWMKAVGLGGVVLGIIGLIVAGGMYFDLFAAQPEVPATGGAGAGGGAPQ